MKQTYPIRLFRSALLGLPLAIAFPTNAAEPEGSDVVAGIAAEAENTEKAVEEAAAALTEDQPSDLEATPVPDPAGAEGTPPPTPDSADPALAPAPAQAAAPDPAAEESTAPIPEAERADRRARPDRPDRPGAGRDRPEAADKPGRGSRQGRPQNAAENPASVDPAKDAEQVQSESPVKEEAPAPEMTERPNAGQDAAPQPEKTSESAQKQAAESPAQPSAEPAPVQRETRERQAEDEVADAKAPTEQPVAPAQPMSEPEQQAETQVLEATREVERELDQRKARLQSPQEARALIEDIIGAESRISRAEIAREERMLPRMQEMRQGRGIEAIPPQQRTEAVEYFQRRLLGQNVEGPQPEFFQHSPSRKFSGPRRRGIRETTETTIIEESYDERIAYERPRYLHEGRRYVHFDSAASVPAILMAAQAMEQVQFHRAPEVGPMLYERRNVSAPNAMPLPPEAYRDEESLVVSYPVDEKSMISSDDILFQQGSTQFADPYSYEVVAALGEAMKKTPDNARFVIEGHASAEGTYEANMELSQQRAERIVREMVRQGVSPYRLLPVGYGESEARYPEDARESVRSQDRRVVVFRLKEEPVASR